MYVALYNYVINTNSIKLLNKENLNVLSTDIKQPQFGHIDKTR